MTLHEAIYQTLIEADRPMTAREVAEVINSRSQYLRKDKATISTSQVMAQVSHAPQEFDYIQGEIILSQDFSWGEILRSYKYLQDLLRNLSRVDTGVLVVFLLFYKRISDLSDLGNEYELPSQARVNFLRNSLYHSRSFSIIDNLRHGVDYLGKQFYDVSYFFYQQLELISTFEKSLFYEIINSLSHFETGKLDNRKFGKIFEYLVQKSFSGTKGEYHFTPQPIAELFGNLVDLEGVSKVYDPCAGLGGLLTEINKQSRNEFIHYFASDLNARVSWLGSLNLILNGIKQFDYKNVDCLLDPFDLKFDLIISDLPLISRVNDSIDLDFIRRLGLPNPSKKSGMSALVLHALSKLRPGGKAFLTVPEGFLSGKGYAEVTRRFLIDNGLIEAVISLPPHALNPYTSVKVSILCLNSRGTNQVKFIDGTKSFLAGTELGSRTSSVDDIIEAYKWNNFDTRISTVIPSSAIRRNECLLSVDRYSEIYREVGRLLEEGNAQLLESVVAVRSGTSTKNIFEHLDDGSRLLLSESQIQIIKAENLKKDILDVKITPQDVSNFVERDGSVERSILKEKCLLIARIGGNPKPTIFDPADFNKQVAINRGVYALVPHKSSQISAEYLYYQFYSPFIQQQLANLRIGATIPHISISNLAKLVIPVVDSVEQNKLVSAQRANLIQLEREKIDERLRMLGYEKEVADKESDIVRILVHQLRPTFLSLNSQVEVIMRVVEKNQLEDFREFSDGIPNFGDPELLALGIAPNQPANYSLKEICDKLLKDSKDINDKLTYVNKVMAFNLNKGDFQESGIKAFITNRINEIRVNNPLPFRIEVSGEECSIEFNKESVGELVDQLVSNAQAHAFPDSGHHNNLVRFNIKTNKNSPVVLIDYSNNGKDIKITLEQFTSPFQKSQGSKGSGIGGYYIKRIIEAHRGALFINDKHKRGFALTIELPYFQKADIYE